MNLPIQGAADAMYERRGDGYVSPEAADDFIARAESVLLLARRRLGDEQVFWHMDSLSRTTLLDALKNHIASMAVSLRLGHVDRVLDLGWSFVHVCQGQNIPEDMVRLAVRSVREAIEAVLGPDHAKEVGLVYGLILQSLAVLAQSMEVANPGEAEPDQALSFNESRQALEFLQALIDADATACEAMADSLVKSPQELPEFYLDVVQPAMYKVGRLWEAGSISVAEEHVSTAIVTKVLVGLYLRLPMPDRNKGKVVVSASANELHEIGAWMVANCLELDGWEVRYLGANMPGDDLMEYLKADPPDILALSAALPLSMLALRDVIARVRREAALSAMKIMIGGYLFRQDEDLVSLVDADGFARDCGEAVGLAREWWQERTTCAGVLDR